MLLWTLACVSKPPEAGLTGSDTDPTSSPTGTTSGSTPTPSTDTLPSGWSQVQIWRAGLSAVCSDGTTTWVVDYAGGVLQVGSPWQDLGATPPSSQSLQGADASNGTLWAVTHGTLERFDGSGWSAVPLPEALFSPSAVVARADGTVAVLTLEQPTTDCYYGCTPSVTNLLGLWDGTSWTVHASEGPDSLHDLVETSDGELVAVGSAGWVARWDGASWVDLHRGGAGALRAVAVGGDELVAVGDQGLVVRGPVDALVAETAGTADTLYAVDVGEDGTAWALSYAGAYVRDGGWSAAALPEGGGWADIGATADGALLVGSQAGPTAILGGLDGWSVAWRQAALSWVQDVWLDTDGTAWFAARDGVGRWDASGFEAWEMPHPDWIGPGEVRAISGSGPDDVVGASGDGVIEWNGEHFALVYPVDDGILWDVAVLPDGTAFAAGSQDNPDESQVPMLLRRDVGVWSVDPTPIPTPARTLIALQAFAPDDVYALTWKEPAVLLHFDGAAWTELTPDLGEGYEALWGRSGADLYLGRSSEETDLPLLHWDGVALTEIAGAPPHVRAIAGTDTALLVSATDGWDSEFAPFITMWQQDTWTEMLRSDEHLAVGGRGETALLTDSIYAQRGPLSSW